MARADTIEAWALALIETESLDEKLSPAPRPAAFAPDALATRVEAPGRPTQMTCLTRARRTPRAGALRDRRRRAELYATFFGHELQAAELMAWAVLAFPETPEAFRRGLLRICDDELRHASLYAGAVQAAGGALLAIGWRDWFWERVPSVTSPASFVALLGLGLEGANLDHSTRFEALLREAGDDAGAALQAQIGEEEIAHVRFAARWFTHFTGELSFEGWRRALPPPLTPAVLRGRPLARGPRRAAGLDEAFLDALEAVGPTVGR